MKYEEERAEEYLKSLNIGLVVFEPHGNVCPDFAVGNDIAVEVRRLNQSYKCGAKLRGLEDDRIPLIAKLRTRLEAFEVPVEGDESHSWFVSFTIRHRPIDTWRDLACKLDAFLMDFYWSGRSKTEAHLTPAVSLSIIPANKKLSTLLRLGGHGDFEAGGRVIPELQKNIGFCIEAKSSALESLAHYRERWLLLVDHVRLGRKQNILIDKGGWDKVILLSPEGKLTAYEPESKHQSPP